MYVRRLSIALCAVGFACTPKLTGVCATNSDCRPGESCSSGICLRDSAVTAGDGGGTPNGGNPDGSTPDGGGNPAASIDILSPSNGAFQRGTFHVSAQAASYLPIQDVTFYLTNSSTGAALGQIVASQAINVWAADLTVSGASFGGNADLVAVLHRSGFADVVSAKVTIIIDQNAPTISPSWDAGSWWTLDAGITVTAAVADDRSGVASAELALPDGGTYTASISGGTATFQLPAVQVGTGGAAVSVPVTLAATDRAGNRGGGASVTSTLRVDDQPPSITLQALDPSVWRNGPLDVNANLSDGTGSGVASASLLLNGAFTAGTPDGGGGYTFHTDLSALPPMDAGVTMQIVAADGVANQADAGFSINVDNVPPTVAGAQIDTAFDGTDSSNQGWFSGPTVSPSGGAITVSALVTDANLVTSGSSAPAVVVAGARYAGTLLSSGRWSFSIPRSVGANASAPVIATFDAQDLAGNHPASPPSLSLQFDDVPAASFVPATAADSSWHMRSGSLPVAVSFTVAPRSGFASVLLKVSGQADVTCTSAGALSWSCSLPLTDLAAGTEGPLGFSVVATSVTHVSSNNTGSRNVDDANPVISNASAIPYPAGNGWGHDGSHFTLRDSGTLYTFTAYDCGSGLSTSLVSFALSPQLNPSNTTIAASGSYQKCANGTNATIYNVAVAGDLSTSTPGSFSGADNTLTVSATVQDGVGHQAAASKGVNATRRLWQTGNISASWLTLGPALVVVAAGAIQGLRLSDGTNLWTNTPGDTILAPPALGGTAANPIVFYGFGGLNTKGTVVELSALTGSALLGNCSFDTGTWSSSSTCTVPNRINNDPTLPGIYRKLTLAIATDGSAAFGQTFVKHGTNTTTGDCGNGQFWAGTMNASACNAWYSNALSTTSVRNVMTLAFGRSGRAFQGNDSYSVSGAITTPALEEVASGSGTINAGPPCSDVTLTDNAGNDSILCGAGRYTFNGAFTTNWTGAGWASITAPSAGVYFSTTAGYSLVNGALAINNFTGTPLAVDASSSPVLYWANGVTLSASRFSATAVGAAAWGLPALPGTSITDVVMDKSGNLYVSSGGQVSAIATDSPGLGTGNYGWPVRGRDACRSSNLEYACPY